MTLHRDAPRSIAGALSPLRRSWAPESLLAEVQELWPEIVGAQIAGAAMPVGERAGVLTVRCSESGWAQELDMLGAGIVTRLNGQLRRGSVSRLRCVTEGR